LRNSIPELDGLRGLAIIPVVLYHCHGKLGWHPLESLVQWGWAGVNLFFVLSGFLITGIIVDGRSDPHFFRNFYGRRSLRIWPVYVLLLALHYVIVPLIFGNVWTAINGVRSAPWIYYVLFVQNLFAVSMPGTIAPTWSLAVEEQFYVVWAPVARFLRDSALVAVAIAVLVFCPLLRQANLHWIMPTNTLIHMDGLAVGALVAVGIRKFRLSQAVWSGLGLTAMTVGGTGAVYLLWHGSAFSDSMLALLFGGTMLTAIVTSGRSNPLNACLRVPPLRFYGRISYGLYMTHILAFVIIGSFDEAMQAYGTAGSLIVVAVRLTLATLVATIMWEKFEKPILKLKHRFEAKPVVQQDTTVAEPVPVG
jgi:peptidoglycan/LPS O-acetylase OafA/YrhL